MESKLGEDLQTGQAETSSARGGGKKLYGERWSILRRFATAIFAREIEKKRVRARVPGRTWAGNKRVSRTVRHQGEDSHNVGQRNKEGYCVNHRGRGGKEHWRKHLTERGLRGRVVGR